MQNQLPQPFMISVKFITLKLNLKLKLKLNLIIKDKTCFKNPTWIDLMITNRPRSFKHSMVVKTGSLDFSKMYVTVMKTVTTNRSGLLSNIENSKFFQ